MISDVKRVFKNLIGTKNNRKLVAFFVDDYGSIRTKNKAAYEQFVKAGIEFSQANFSFSNYDTLADRDDLLLLFEVLRSAKDKNGSFGCFTPFSIVANPDFEKIRESGFSQYHREPFNKTLQKYGSFYDTVYDLWLEGIKENIFHPVYHGTEHLNVKRFMNALKTGHKSTQLAFDNESICIPVYRDEIPVVNPTANFDLDSLEENEHLKDDIVTGLKMFCELFGYQTKVYTPGAARYHPDLHRVLYENGIHYISANRTQLTPLGNGKYKKKIYYNGQRTKEGQYFIVRNGVFEPHGKTGTREADNCLKDIEAAFRWSAPAVISSHRVNFVGHFDKSWRDNSVKQLKYLLEQITKRWPDAEFVNGDDLGDILFRRDL